ncbi:MAG: molybdopterin molybdotransferase MoeA [Alphaproteobacteria bacterium]|nr:molybdopterin molybdotransferase MoeA [Alphaproteobacteria bacterium]
MADLSLDEALASLRDAPCVAGTEFVALGKALGHVLAEDVVSPLSVPPHDNSAMDGVVYAQADLSPDSETRLTLAGTIAAGHPLDRPMARGEAFRIFTGAPIPVGGDGVVMQEDCRFEDGFVTLPANPRIGEHIRRVGEDVTAGAQVLTAGTRLRPQEVGVAALIGRTGLAVRRPLKVAVLSSGDEVVEPGRPLPPGAIYDSNRPTVIALARALGFIVTDLGRLPDRLEVVKDALARVANDHDAIITTGGVSVGGEDHMRAAVLSLGRLEQWRLKMKPGKPVALGEIGRARFIGLPGNPVSAMVTFMMIARPLLLRMSGATWTTPPRFPVAARFALRRKPGRREFLRARLIVDQQGLGVETHRSDSSGVLTSMAWADGLIDVPATLTEVTPGMMIDYLPLSEVLS